MTFQKHLFSMLGILLVVALLGACASPAAAPTATPVLPTSTPVPSTPTPVPATATPLPEASTPAPPSQASTGKVTTESGEITSQALAGNLLGDPTTRKFYVVLPPGYATSDKHYPVVYVLHGYFDLPTHMVGPFKRAYENALRASDVQEMIFVFPDAGNKLGGSLYDNTITIGDYETYLTRELVQQIDATYRTLPDRRSRGITGCSMGGDGSIHLALINPDVFNVIASTSGTYGPADTSWFNVAASLVTELPEDFSDLNLSRFPWEAKLVLAVAAASAPNPDKPPFYFDMPFAIEDGQGQLVPDVLEKMKATEIRYDLDGYLLQPEQLDGILLYHGINDPYHPVELARNFDQKLTDLGVDHEYLEVDGGHCDLPYDPVVKFMSDNLVGEEPVQN